MDIELSENEKNILNEIHLKIDQTNDVLEILNILTFNEEFSENLYLFMRIEYFTLSKIKQTEFGKLFHGNELVKKYLLNRIQNCKNDYQTARYNRFLFNITNDSNFAQNAIDLYFQIFINFVNGKTFSITDLDFELIFYVICELTFKTKYQLNEFKNFIHDLLLNQSNINFRIKTTIIHFIFYYDLNKDNLKNGILKNNWPVNQDTIKKIFSSELIYIPELCYSIAQNETVYVKIDSILKIGLIAAQKTHNNEMIRKINELLGDNEYNMVSDSTKDPDNIIIPHQNCSILRKIIEYYTISKNTIKIEKALKDYDINKNICKYIELSIPLHSDQNSEFDKLQFENYKHLIELPTNKIIFHFILGGKLFCINSVTLEHLASINENYLHNIFFQHIISDINNNETQISSLEIQKKFIYLNALNETIYLVHFIFLTCIKNKKLSYTKIKTFLNSDLFFGEILICKNHNRETSYNWFSLIDIGLKSFFDQYNLLLKNKEPDWRFTIDFLSLKFEGILRDILMLLGDSTTKLKDGNTREMLFDELLRIDKLKKCFTQDDLNLFIYTFTNKGLNIRNNIAHSFYKPKDYTVEMAIVVLLCILRLAKFKIGLNSKQIIP